MCMPTNRVAAIALTEYGIYDKSIQQRLLTMVLLICELVNTTIYWLTITYIGVTGMALVFKDTCVIQNRKLHINTLADYLCPTAISISTLETSLTSITWEY